MAAWMRNAVHMDIDVTSPAADTAPQPKRDSVLIAILVAIGVLVLLAIIVVFSRGTPDALDPSTPEGVVQRYTTAVIDGDEDAAAEYLTADLREDCNRFETGMIDNVRVTLVSTTVRAESADVRVSITQTYQNGPFGVSESSYQDVFDLALVDGHWLIEATPWQFVICPAEPVAP